MNKPKLLYTPYPKATDNPYLRSNVALLEELGFEVIAEPTLWGDRGKFLLKHLIKRDIDSVVVNWHENLFRHRDGRVNWMGIPIYLISLLLFRLMSRRVVYIRHNLYPHSFTQHWKRSLAKMVVGIGQKIAQVRATHSGHMRPAGFQYLPHTLYKTFKSDHLEQVDVGCSLPEDFHVMFGFIERYKRVDEVIRCWNNAAYLVIAGNCKDQNYLDELHRLAEGKNILFITRFIKEDEAQKIVGLSRGLIIAHADEDMIVSGSFFFGISVGAPLFAVRTPFLDWYKQNDTSNYLRLFETIDSLVTAATSNHQPPNLTKDRMEQIRVQFSNENIKAAWSKLLDVPSLNESQLARGH